MQAIPSLEEQFGRTTDVGTKTEIANGLARLGDKHNTYWNYLLEQATLAVDSGVSDEAFIQSQGKMTNQSLELHEKTGFRQLGLLRFDFPIARPTLRELRSDW